MIYCSSEQREMQTQRQRVTKMELASACFLRLLYWLSLSYQLFISWCKCSLMSSAFQYLLLFLVISYCRLINSFLLVLYQSSITFIQYYFMLSSACFWFSCYYNSCSSTLNDSTLFFSLSKVNFISKNMIIFVIHFTIYRTP